MFKEQYFPDFCFVFYLEHKLLSLDQVRDKKNEAANDKKDPPELNFSMCERHNWSQSFFFCSCKPCSVCNNTKEMENLYLSWQEDPHVSHHILHVHSAPSPSVGLFWCDGCNLIRGTSIHGLVCVPVHSGADNNMEAVLQVVFLPARLLRALCGVLLTGP